MAGVVDGVRRNIDGQREHQALKRNSLNANIDTGSWGNNFALE